ncbi:unnamed protein product [Allacma fusca]|uniref:Spondin domain-containing protein n=1 Tax=Allacma fusca TaxID=39272 RepID=A0A8J2LY87_9HEXA|nr:unnamed protein product [Allacma fusca]
MKCSSFPGLLVTFSFVSSFFLFITIVCSVNSCKDDRLIVYRVVLNTFWSRQRFPKHYPEWRPPASFSRLIGRSHASPLQNFYELDKVASEGMKIFAETGASDVLDELSQGEGGIFDEFNAPPIPQGVGRTEAEFFVDGNHSRVSLISRIVPSPDWFVGLSSFNLCSNGRWIDNVTLEEYPFDAGTDNGFTFTSPNWPTEPRSKISRLTSKQPNHPASSFYYPEREVLPPIASFQFLKVKEYELSQVFHHPEPETVISSNDVIDPESRPIESNLKSATAASSVSNGPIAFNSVSEYLPDKILSKKKDKKHKLKKFRPPRDCRVSEWGPWSPCSKSCGIGEMIRTRTVIVHPRRGGRPCLPLKDATFCGSARSCGRSYFNW